MSWHRVWLIKCDQDDCPQAHVTSNPDVIPEGWATDGTRHLCPESREKDEVREV